MNPDQAQCFVEPDLSPNCLLRLSADDTCRYRVNLYISCGYLLYPRYEVYRGYIVFAFSVIMFVCLFVCKLFFFVKDFSATTWVRILKFGTKLDSDELYCVTIKQPHIAYQSLYFIHFSFSPMEISVTDFSAPIGASVLKFCVHLQVGKM